MSAFVPFVIDPSTLNFTDFSVGFYLPDPITQSSSYCPIPDLGPANLGLPDQNLTPVQTGCKFDFTAIVPQPPPYVPKPNIVIPPCPQGITIDTAISIVGTGAAVVTGSINSIGGVDTDCTYLIAGGINIYVPPPPCPLGMSFSGTASITTSGIATGGGSIQLLGGPCNYELSGNININVDPPPGSSPFGGNDTPGVCQECGANCSTIAAAIVAAYTAKGSTPLPGDIIDLCVYTYEVVLNATSTCGNTPPTINVVPFTVSSINYLARQISESCTTCSPFFVTVDVGSPLAVTLCPGTLLPYLGGSPMTIANQYSSLLINTNDIVYLEVTVLNLVPTAATLCTNYGPATYGPSGIPFNPTATPWTGTGSIADNDGTTPPTGPNQTYARYLIATITGSVSAQNCYANLIMSNVGLNNEPAILPLTT